MAGYPPNISASLATWNVRSQTLRGDDVQTSWLQQACGFHPHMTHYIVAIRTRIATRQEWKQGSTMSLLGVVQW